jgi:O-acetyl-ADP-ribose deacetylase (regulator of RNase III)
MIRIVNGSLLDANEKYIGHQCNSVSNRASGIARSIFDTFPFSNIYSHRPYPYTAKREDFPGQIVVCGDGQSQRLIINIIAQYYPGAAHQNSLLDSSEVREGYFNVCLHEIAKIEKLESIAFPFLIGCGLASGNWEHYLIMLEAFAQRVWDEQKATTTLYKLAP